jgi:hypothetical protein
MGASDASYGCVFQQEDEDSTTGQPLLSLTGMLAHAMKQEMRVHMLRHPEGNAMSTA